MKRLFAGLLLVALATSARAQDPVRLPGVRVTAPIEKPGAPAIIGIVRDTMALPLDGVELSIVDLKRRVFAGNDGRFRIDNIKPGEYTVRARRIGFAPQQRVIKVDRDGGVGEFELVPMAQSLLPMIVSSSRGGLSGVVADTAFKAMRGAVVRLLGKGRIVETDSMGYFSFPIQPGQYWISIQETGFAPKTVAVRVPKDSGKHVAIYLEPRTGKLNPRSVHNIEDLASRMATRMTNNSTVYFTEDLEKMGVTFIGDAIQGAVTRTAAKTFPVDDDCYAILNGGPEIISVKGLTREDVVSMEVYTGRGVSAPPIPTVQKSSYTRWARKIGTAITGMTNTDEALSANWASNKSCPTIYVWKK